MQTKITKLIESAPKTTLFELHDTHNRRSVCKEYIPDGIATVCGKSLVPLNVAFVLELKGQDATYNTPENVGELIRNTRIVLEQLPITVRARMLAAITDRKKIQWFQVNRAMDESGKSVWTYKKSVESNEVQLTLLAVLCSSMNTLGIKAPSIQVKGSTVEALEVIGTGQTSHVFRCTLQGEDLALKVSDTIQYTEYM